MTSPRKPDELDLLLMLADSLGSGDPGRAVDAAEARGQRELVSSEVIPTKGSDALAELGFTLGDPVDGDPIFRQATLPEGWQREPSDHSMWSYIVDELGRRRVSMFYKAAFYDRSAHCHPVTVYGYVSTCLYEGTQPILDESWATRETVLAQLTAVEREARESIDLWSGRTEPYAREYEQEARDKVAKIEALRASLGGAS